MNLSKEERYLLSVSGWTIKKDDEGNETPFIYYPEDYDGCHADGEDSIKHCIDDARTLHAKYYGSNEQLEKLVWQVVESLEPITDAQPLKYSVEYHKRLAELIVRQCMDICEQQRLKILSNPHDPSWTEHLAECKTAMEQTLIRN